MARDNDLDVARIYLSIQLELSGATGRALAIRGSDGAARPCSVEEAAFHLAGITKPAHCTVALHGDLVELECRTVLPGTEARLQAGSASLVPETIRKITPGLLPESPVRVDGDCAARILKHRALLDLITNYDCAGWDIYFNKPEGAAAIEGVELRIGIRRHRPGLFVGLP